MNAKLQYMKRFLVHFIVLTFLPLATIAQTAKSVSATTETADDLFKQGSTAYNAKDWKKAVFFYNKAIKADANYWRAYYNRAQIYMMQNQNKEALLDLRAAAKINNKSAEIQNTIGVICLQTKQLPAAEAAFTEAIRINPNYMDALGNRAELYRNMAKYTEALVDVDKVLSIKPDQPNALHTKAAVLSQQKKYAEALVLLDKLMLKNPAQAAPYIERGDIRFQLKKYKEAAQDYTQALFIRPDIADLYIKRGKARLKFKDDDSACDDFTKAASLNDPEAETLMHEYCHD